MAVPAQHRLQNPASFASRDFVPKGFPALHALRSARFNVIQRIDASSTLMDVHFAFSFPSIIGISIILEPRYDIARIKRNPPDYVPRFYVNEVCTQGGEKMWFWILKKDKIDEGRCVCRCVDWKMNIFECISCEGGNCSFFTHVYIESNLSMLETMHDLFQTATLHNVLTILIETMLLDVLNTFYNFRRNQNNFIIRRI